MAVTKAKPAQSVGKSAVQEAVEQVVGKKSANDEGVLYNYISSKHDAPSIPQKLAEMALIAKTKGQVLMVSEIRYAIAGTPDIICDEYIHWPAGAAIEVGSTGKLGDTPEEFERNPGEKMVAMQSFCFAEFVKEPKG
jgi:hypothetical protein